MGNSVRGFAVSLLFSLFPLGFPAIPQPDSLESYERSPAGYSA